MGAKRRRPKAKAYAKVNGQGVSEAEFCGLVDVLRAGFDIRSITYEGFGPGEEPTASVNFSHRRA